MKSLLSVGVLLSLAVSSASLGYQVGKNSKVGVKLAKYNVPARMTELDRRFEGANVAMIRNSLAMQEGVGAPWIWGITDDNNHVVLRVVVSDRKLPASYDERKKVLENAAAVGIRTVIGEFDEVTINDITVEFKDMDNITRPGVDPNKNYATFSNGELTFQ